MACVLTKSENFILLILSFSIRRTAPGASHDAALIPEGTHRRRLFFSEFFDSSVTRANSWRSGDGPRCRSTNLFLVLAQLLFNLVHDAIECRHHIFRTVGGDKVVLMFRRDLHFHCGIGLVFQVDDHLDRR